jgi:phenylacetate-CoA ligase
MRYVDFASLRFLWWRGEPLRYISDINYARIKIDAPSNAHRLFTPIKDYLENPRAALERIAAFKPELLSSYPSILLDIAQQVEKDPALRFPTLRFVMSIGETLVPSVRTSVETALKCEVYDRYGLEEIGAVGVDCAQHDGFHINTESVIVEVVDEAGQPLPNGQEGRIVVTNLFNYGMPFIRYDTGDHGVLSNQQCACGLASPRVWVKGRYSAYLTFPQRRIHHLEFDGAMDKLMNYVFKYQIAKRSDIEIWARIIAGPAFHSGVPDMIEKSLRELVGPNIRISVKEVSELPVTSRGKSRIVIDESERTLSD